MRTVLQALRYGSSISHWRTRSVLWMRQILLARFCVTARQKICRAVTSR